MIIGLLEWACQRRKEWGMIGEINAEQASREAMFDVGEGLNEQVVEENRRRKIEASCSCDMGGEINRGMLCYRS